MKRLLPILLLVILLPAQAGARADTPRVSVNQQLDKTAIFPGDRLDYHVQIRCAPGTDILAGDMDADELALDGLEVIASRREHRAAGEGLVYDFHYRLTSYETGTAVLHIGGQAVRYYDRRPGQAPDRAVPAGEITLPSLSVALRSTLPETDPALLELRDGRAASVLPSGIGRLRLAAAVLILIAVLPLLLRVLGDRRRNAAAPDRVAAAAPDPRLLEELASVDAADAAARRGGYDRLDTLLRQRLAADIAALSLTADEAAQALAAAGLPVSADDVAAVLADCERARYGREGNLPPAERFRAGVALARRLLEQP